MKVRPILAICALTLLVPGCASTSNKMASASYDDGYDHAYMAKVERADDSTGVQLIWINPPQAKTHDN